MGDVAQEYEDELLRSWNKPNIQINHVIFKNRKIDMKSERGRHTRSNHEYHMKRFKRCVYCDCGGEIIEEPLSVGAEEPTVQDTGVCP